MDAASIAAAFAMTQAANTRQALGAAAMKSQVQADQAVVALLAEGAASAEALQAAAPAGTGSLLDITV